jgi:hypothetical protein
MILATKIQSEKGKEITKTANEFIFQEITVKKQKVGEIELYYFNDSVDDPKNCKAGEWLLKYRPAHNGQEEEDKPDWDIIAQGNI